MSAIAAAPCCCASTASPGANFVSVGGVLSNAPAASASALRAAASAWTTSIRAADVRRPGSMVEIAAAGTPAMIDNLVIPNRNLRVVARSNASMKTLEKVDIRSRWIVPDAGAKTPVGIEWLQRTRRPDPDPPRPGSIDPT